MTRFEKMHALLQKQHTYRIHKGAFISDLWTKHSNKCSEEHEMTVNLLR